MRHLLLGLVLIASLPLTAGAADDDAWHRLVGILSYLEADYPGAVETQDAFELEEQRTFIQEALRAAQEIGGPAARFVPRLQSIQARVLKAEDPQGVSRECGLLSQELVLAGGLKRSPSKPPDLARAAEQFGQLCASCHGTDGRADLPIAKTMTPPPANFHDPARMEVATPYSAFNTITFGVQGTGMVSYAGLSEAERWALAFYVFTLRQPDCRGNPPSTSLEYLATQTDGTLAADHGADQVPCLRRKIPELDEEQYLVTARTGIEEALRVAAGGDVSAARGLIVDAYLQGFEPVEPRLRGRNAALVQQVEEGFAAMRVAAERNPQALQEKGKELLSLIDKARGAQSGSQGMMAVFWLTLLILMREGFEVLIILVALLAVLKKMGHQEHAKLVHLGWIAAALAGLALFFFARGLINGARRELIEGVVALIAVVMLLYAALWINARANVRKMMGELRTKVSAALGRDSRLGLFAIAFFAMFRETFETALFLQGLSIDSPQGVLGGAVAGLLVLAALVLLIKRVGYVLPMKTLFNVSTGVLVVTAIILLGKGLRALQEVGTLPLRPIRFVTIDLLGIFPDLVTLLPQALLSLVPLIYLRVQRRRSQRDGQAVAGQA
ncbi:MAG: FTR1 family protein [Myxococcota bacterium]|nr:FTR1 family protein [Myxococcota bacterium]